MRTTMVCIGPPNQRFQSRLFSLFDQLGLSPLNFVSIRLESSIWSKFQVEGSYARVVRLKAKIQNLNGVDLCLELQSVAALEVQKLVTEGIASLGISTPSRTKRDGPTFRGLQ